MSADASPAPPTSRTPGRHEYVLSLLVPFAILCVTFAVRGIYPFGSLSVSVWDMDIQYVGYFGWLCKVLYGQASLFYSFSQGLGEGTAALFSYHLSSPFNLLLVFFDPSHILEFLSWLTLVKLPFAGLTCYAFLRKRYGGGTIEVLLSSSYALCGYVVVQCSNIMWMDGVIMLPLVALGTWRVVHERSCLTLFLSVAGCIIFNWYTGYMDCLFSLLYFLWCRSEEENRAPFREDALRYLATMFLGLGLSLFLFLPAVLGLLSGTEGTFVLKDLLSPSRIVSLWQLLDGFCITGGASSSEAVQPTLYMSAAALVLGGAFFASKDVPRRRKAALALLLAASLAGILLSGPATVWSVLKKATSFYFRHGFVVDFTLVVAAAEGWRALSRTDPASRGRALRISAVVVTGLICLGYVGTYVLKGVVYQEPRALALEIGLLLCSAALLARALGLPAGRRARGAVAVLAALVAVELGVNAYSVFGHYKKDVTSYDSYLASMTSTYDTIREDSGGSATLVGQAGFGAWGTRTTGTTPTTADSFLYGTQGLSEYTSTVNGSTETLMQALGYSESYLIFGHYYNSPQLLPDTLLGMGYVISSTQPVGSTLVTSENMPYAGYALYRYDDVLPFGYGIAAGAGDVTWTSDPFSNQASMLSDMTGTDASSVYAAATVVDAQDQATGGATRTFEVTTAAAGPLYIDSPLVAGISSTGIDAMTATVKVNGTTVQIVGDRFNSNVIYVGTYDEGVTLEVSFEFAHPNAETSYSTRSASVSDRLWTAGTSEVLVARTLDESVLSEALSSLDTAGFVMDDFEDGYVSCDFDATSDETLLLRIPYDAGWVATVDGQQVDVSRCYSGLVGVSVSAGQHHVELRYETPGLEAGIVASILSAATFVIWRARGRRRAVAGR